MRIADVARWAAAVAVVTLGVGTSPASAQLDEPRVSRAEHAHRRSGPAVRDARPPEPRIVRVFGTTAAIERRRAGAWETLAAGAATVVGGGALVAVGSALALGACRPASVTDCDDRDDDLFVGGGAAILGGALAMLVGIVGLLGPAFVRLDEALAARPRWYRLEGSTAALVGPQGAGAVVTLGGRF